MSIYSGTTDQIFRGMRHQRCWVHKTANVLNKLPKSAQPEAKLALHEIWMAETKKNAEAALDIFLRPYEDKYPGTVQCLLKDQDELLAFYDFFRGALEEHTHHQPHQVNVHHDQASNQTIQGLPIGYKHASHDVQTWSVCTETLASIERF